jgi:hypothetical protein
MHTVSLESESDITMLATKKARCFRTGLFNVHFRRRRDYCTATVPKFCRPNGLT